MFYIDLKYYINSILRHLINLFIKLSKIFIYSEFIKFSSNSKNLLKNVKRISSIIRIVFIIIIVTKIETLFKKVRKIILIIIIMIIRNQKLISLIYRLLLNTYIIIIKKFIDFVISSFITLNKNAERNFRRKFRRKFQIHYRLFS